VKRSPDNTTKDIGVLATGFADSVSQDRFCGQPGVTCVIQQIFDQSKNGNHISTGYGGPIYARKPDKGVNATKSKLTVGGHSVYAAYFEGGMGYRNDNTSGVATGDEPESLYMVAAGKHYNSECCFDYGNAEINARDDGKGTMEAIYFGNSHFDGTHGGGNGPWVMADLENGVWGGNKTLSPDDFSIDADFVTVMLKGKSGGFALKGADAQAGALKTMYEGERPPRYNPMKKQGAIILGIGGDNSNKGVGTFYEGAITKGYASDATDAAVHANIAAAGYGR
jgi:hypothetical protein